jgi:SAM-dependent methyltransferase
MDAAYAAIGRTSADYWSRRTGNQSSVLRTVAVAGDPILQLLRTRMSAGSTLLDVGAGAGRYALALAPQLREVVAVEPDSAMLPALESAIQSANAQNVTIVRSIWQDAGVPSADFVLCAHVLYPIADAAEFVLKLDCHATRACFVVLRETAPDPEPLGELWRRFHGEPRYLQPGYVEAFDLLHEVGIHANVSVCRIPGPSWAFEDLDRGVAFAREHLILPQSEEIDEELRAALKPALIADGALLRLPASEAYAGVLWWERKAPD